MKFLHVIATIDPALGGPPEGLRQICNAARKLGVSVDVLCTDHASDAFISGFPAQVHALGPARGGAFAYCRATLPWLRQHASGYDAVVVHGLWQHMGRAVRMALKKSSTPYFVFPHGMLDPWFRKRFPLKHFKKQWYWNLVEHANLRRARAVLFTTEEEARLAEQTFAAYDVQPLVIGYGINVTTAEAEADSGEFFQRFPELQGKRILLFMGRLHTKKGCDLLLQAFARVAARDESLHLVMAGPGGAYREQLVQLAASLGIANRICWPGMISGNIKWGALRAAEAFVLASHQENFGVAVVEALAAGLPVLISNQVNIWREIDACGAGFVGPDTVEGTVSLLTRWLDTNPAVWRNMGVAARACYARHFRADAVAARLVNLVETGGIS